MKTLLIVDDNVELASLLAVVAEVHGFVPRVAHTGRAALEMLEAELPEAALVDLLLPDIPGQDVLKQLHERGVITFAMSGVYRGEHFARAAVDNYGARAYFEKPFAARDAMMRLVGLVQQAQSAPKPPPAPPPSAPDEPERAAAPAQTPLLEELDSSAETTGAFARPVPPPPPPADAIAPEPPPADEPSLPPSVPEDAAPPADEPGLEAAVQEATYPAAAPSTAAQAAPLPFSGRDVWSNAATPEAVAQPPGPEGPTALTPGVATRLLALLARQGASGELRVKRKDIVKVVGVAEGKVVFAASNLGSERLSRFAQRAGKIPTERAGEFLHATRAGQRTGDTLVALGLCTEAERVELIGGLVREVVWSLLDVADGEVHVVARAPARKGLLPLSLETVPLLLEGYRRAPTLLRLRELVDLERRYVRADDPPFAPDSLPLSPGERELWAAADGSKTVEDLVLLSELGEREALAALVGLCHLGVLEARAVAQRRIMLV